MVEIIIKEKKWREAPRPGRVFFSQKVDMGANGKFNNRPAWQMKRHVEGLKEDIESKKRILEDKHAVTGAVDIGEFKQLLAKQEERLGEIMESEDIARKVIKEDPDFWHQKHKEMGKKISDNMPTETDYHKRRPNPHKIANMEKEKFKDGMTSQEYKSDWQVLGRALDKESDVTNLVRNV